MMKIDLDTFSNLESAYAHLQEMSRNHGEVCNCVFNGVELFSTETLDEVYKKVIGRSKKEHDDYLDNYNAARKREKEEHIERIPELTEQFRSAARGIIPEEGLKEWDEIVPIRLNDIYKGMELSHLLELCWMLNNPIASEVTIFQACHGMFISQGHSGMSASLVFDYLKQFHPLGDKLVEYIKNQKE